MIGLSHPVFEIQSSRINILANTTMGANHPKALKSLAMRERMDLFVTICGGSKLECLNPNKSSVGYQNNPSIEVPEYASRRANVSIAKYSHGKSASTSL